MRNAFKFATGIVLLVIMLFVNNTSAAQQPRHFVPRAVPEGVDLKTYPILPFHVLTSAEMAQMGLRPTSLDKAIRVYNYNHPVGGFVVEDLKATELVAVNASGEIIYKVSCSNRISEPKTPTCPDQKPCPPQITCPDPKPCQLNHFPLPPNPTIPPPTEIRKVVEKDDDSVLPGWSKGWLRFFLGLGLALLALALLALILLALVALARRIWNQGSSTPNPPAPVAPLAPPVPALAPVAPIVPLPAPHHPVLGRGQRGNGTEVWWGPFATVSVVDRGTAGYHVNVDGRDVGVYTTPTRMENAGAHGSWLVTT